MCESVLYQCKKMEINNAIEFNENQLVCIELKWAGLELGRIGYGDL